MFHTTPQVIVKGNMGQYGPGEMRVRQTGKQFKEPLLVSQCQTGSQHQVVLQDFASWPVLFSVYANSLDDAVQLQNVRMTSGWEKF